MKTKLNYLMMLSVVMMTVMMLVPSSMRGAITTIDFGPAATAAQFTADNPGNSNYNCTVTMGEDYSPIGNGAKKGVIINWKNSRTNSTDISRVAFLLNTNGVGNADNTGAGFYLRRNSSLSSRPAGLYTGSSGNKLAILGLKPGNKVTISLAAGSVKYVQSVHADEGQGDLYNYNGATLNLTNPITINSLGDLIIEATQGTYIKSITIEEEIATYTILTNSDNSTEFWFTAPGSLEVNDFAIPYMSVSFGSASDYLVVQGSNENDCAAHMFQTTGQYAGTETLSTDASTNWQPSAGNFYAFRPTGGGKVEVSGSLTGNQTHLFVYNPAKNNGNGGWEGDWPTFYSDTYTSGSFSFNVEKDKIYYICIDNGENSGEHSNAFHLHWFKFTPTFRLDELAKVVDLDNDVENGSIKLTKIYGYGNSTNITVKRCTANIDETTVNARIVSNNDGSGYLTIDKPTFASGTDEAGTIILDVETGGGDAAFVVTFPYHANYNPTGYTDTNRTYGHTWNFIDPRNSDSNIGNCKIGADNYSTGTVSGILSIGQYKDKSSQFYAETENREWTYAQRQTGEAGGFHDPYYANVFDMEGDNADMIWETEGLWFDTGTNLSCIYNENDAVDDPFKTNPLNFVSPGSNDPDRYVGLLPVTDDKKSSFTIPGLKPGDRVLIFMKSGEATGTNGIFLNITGAKDALGKAINPSDLYKAGGTNWQHERYEGCYHFIKDETKDPGSEYGRMTFSMNSGSMCKLLYIRIYTGQRIVTTNIVSSATGDAGRLLFMNDKGAALGSDGQGSQFSLRFRGKGQHSTNQVLTYSGNLNAASFTGDNFKVTGAYSHLIDFKSKVGEIGMFRLRMNDVTYEYERNANQKITYVADFCDRNFTVGYRDKVDSYPYTWDFTDIQGFSSSKMDAEADNYPIAAAANDAYGYEWDISLFDADGNMKVNTGWDPITNNLIFSPHKIGFGNQLWAGGDVIPETRGLWFYSEDDSDTDYTSEYSSSLYNDCLQITDEGIRFANVPDDEGKRVAWWNYKMVVPDVPANAAVYLRMKRDFSVTDNAQTLSNQGGEHMVPFLATRFQFASQSGKTEVFTTTEVNGDGNYAFYKVSGTDDEWILAVKNATGNKEHLTFTLNGWIVKKVAVSTDSKKVNVKGWTTESRGRVIDPALTAFMTGRDMRTYIVTDVEYSKTKKQATLTRIDTDPTYKDGCLMPKASDGDKNACIILNCTSDGENGIAGEEANLLDGGFHLFVPDMHDYNFTEDTEGVKKFWASNGIKSLMKSQVSSTGNNYPIPATDGDYTNYAFTCKYYDIDPVTGEKVNSSQALQNGIQAFYRIVGGAKSAGNQGYLPIKIEEETNNENNENNEGGETNPSRAASPARVSASSPERFTIVFNNLSDVSLKVGDVNGDGLFNKLDVNTMADRLAGRPTSKFFSGVADMNNDGKVNIVDMTLMIKSITSE